MSTKDNVTGIESKLKSALVAMESDDAKEEKWVTVDGTKNTIPLEGQRILLVIRNGAQYRKEIGRKKGHMGIFQVDYHAFGYLYCKTRVYLPCIGASVNFQYGVTQWKAVGGPDYYNGSGRDGEENLLNRED